MRVRLVLPARFLRMPDLDDEPPLDSGQKEAGMRLRLLRRMLSEEDEVVVAGLTRPAAAAAVVVEICRTGLLLMGWFPLAGEGCWVSECRREGGEVARGAGGRGYEGR